MIAMCAGIMSRVSAAMVVALLVSACASGPTPSSVILARPTPPLMDTPVLFQRIIPTSTATLDRLDMRAMPRRLVVTTSEFTLPGGNGNVMTPWEFTLSFATVESVEVRTLDYDPLGPMGRGTSIPSAVTITDQRGVCKFACVFIFQDSNGEPDLATANRFAEIVRTGRRIVDPFGRTEGPRLVAAAFGLRAPRPVWHRSLNEQASAVRASATDIEEAVLQFAKTTFRSEFQQCLSTALNADSMDSTATTTWRFVPVAGISVNQDTELSIASVLKSKTLVELDTNSMLVSDIYGLGFTYIPSGGSDPARVETTFRAFVDFYDLEPMKDGRYFWFDYSLQRLMAALVADPVGSVREDIGKMCKALSKRISEEISLHPGNPPDVTGN